ncbi:MAG: sigma-70 family RNA polymerase sigma factor [Actinomycetota bacterium]
MDETPEPAQLEGKSDAALVVAIGRWSQKALAEAYRRHAGAVFTLSQRVLRNRALAEDVVQEVFVRLWYHPDRFDPERGTLRSYLLAQTHGRSVDVARSESSRRRREEKDVAHTIETGHDVAAQVEDLAVSAEVRKALNVLPEAEKKAIQLAYYGGRSYREVAQLLSVPEGTIKSRIRAGLQRLRVALVEAGVGA